MCGVLVILFIWCDCARCDGKQGKLQPKQGFSSGPCNGIGQSIFSLTQRGHRLQQIGASNDSPQNVFPVNFKGRNGHRCKEEETPSHLISLVSLTEISNASAHHVLLFR